jgi:hypothetical protein
MSGTLRRTLAAGGVSLAFLTAAAPMALVFRYFDQLTTASTAMMPAREHAFTAEGG